MTVNKILLFRVCITAYIWNKESHNLFDFESNSCSKKEIEVDFTCNLVVYFIHF